MCGRFSLTLPIQELLNLLEAEGTEIVGPRFNIAPTQQILILRTGPDGQRQLTPVRWGLIPLWADSFPTGAPLINARCETVATKPSFRDAFRSRRCLIPATGFFEWKKEGRKRLPFHITYPDGRLMLFAGIWERWQNPQQPGQIIDSCAVLTSEACPTIEPLHDRMPVLIPADACDLWLEGSPKDVSPLMVPYSGADLLLAPANPIMNSAAVDGPECLSPSQDSLF